MSIFDDLIKDIPEEDRKILDKYQDLKNAMESLEEGGRRYATWYAHHYDPVHDMTKSEWAARQEVEQLRRQLETAQPTSISMEPNDASQIKAEIQKEIDDRLRRQQEEYNRQMAGMSHFYSTAYKLGFNHRDEFGQALDPDELFQYMAKNSFQDPNLAYERMVANKRAELAATRLKELEEKHAQELKEAEERGAARVRQEHTMGVDGMLPTDDVGGIVGVTHIAPSGQIPQEIAEKTAGMKLTDPKLAQAGLEALRKGLIPVQ